MKGIYAIILAGGRSERIGFNKMLVDISGKTPLEHVLNTLVHSDYPPDTIVIVAGEEVYEFAEKLKSKFENVTVTHGGKTRGESVLNGLNCLRGLSGIVSINDAARCLVTKAVLDRSVECALEFSCGVAAIPVRDTLRKIAGEVVDRDGLYSIQTPQTFDLEKIQSAYDKAIGIGAEFTDDLGVWMFAGNKAVYSEGYIGNQKLTYNEDLLFFNDMAIKMNKIRVGIGEDTHLLVEGRDLIIGGINIPYEKGLLGHSDADVLIHAVMDSILGAAGLGDIGIHFPDNDDAYKGISSCLLLRQVAERIRCKGYTLGNIDATIIAQKPKMAPYIPEMRKMIAQSIGCDAEQVNIKATTTEGMNDEGRGLCISARAVCILWQE